MKLKVFAIVAAWILSTGTLVFALMQMQSYAEIINNAGVIRGGTQQAVKLALAGENNDAIVARVDDLLDHLINEETNRVIKTDASQSFLTDLTQVEDIWLHIKAEFSALQTGADTQSLLDLSEQHFKEADKMVLSAQKRAEGDLLWTIIGCVVFILIITTIIGLRERSHQLAQRRGYETDPLTGGYNMTAFERRGGEIISNTTTGTYLVAYSNVEGFRIINESFGRASGDKVIRALHTLLEQACKPGELMAHANADHFVLLLRNTEKRVELLAAQVAARLKVSSDLPFSDHIVCGYGVYEVAAGDDIPTSVSNASVVLKDGVGGDLIARYDDEFRSKLAFEQNVVRRMGDALANDEFTPYVQPQFSLQTGEFVGAEMLCRWKSPDLGFLPPDLFIPLFERNGFITELDFYMLEQACKFHPVTKLNPGDKPRHLAVNLSRTTMLQNDFQERFDNIISRYNTPHACLHIEVTEGVFSVDEDAVTKILENLQSQGFPIAMDDFGTGYSSLSMLRKIPIDVLKIDRAFLSVSEDDARSMRVLESIIDLAKDLGIDTVCEGVETPEQARLLHDLGCEIAQGYLFSKPMPYAEFEKQFSLE